MNNHYPTRHDAAKNKVVMRKPTRSMKNGKTNGTSVLERALTEKNRLNYGSSILRKCSISDCRGDGELPQNELKINTKALE
jgi:N12 class adenine-specific DNA methylase